MERWCVPAHQLARFQSPASQAGNAQQKDRLRQGLSFAAVYAMEGLKREANALNKEIGNLRKVGAAGQLPLPWHPPSINCFLSTG